MKWNTFHRIKERWSRRSEEKRGHFKQWPNLSRRAFVFGTSAVIAGSIIGCRTAPLTEEQIVVLDKMRRVRAEPPLITSLRSGRSVKKALEGIPFIHSQEIGFHKKTPGEIRPATLTRSFDFYDGLSPDSETRSMLHTHPIWNANDPIEIKISTSPSALDIFNLLRKYARKKSSPKLKFSHIAVISPKGEVQGYYTLLIGKKLDRILRERIFPSDERKKYDQVMKSLYRTHQMSLQNASYATYLRLEKNIKDLQKIGLHIRQTPMPGYVFKDGYFQLKTKK